MSFFNTKNVTKCLGHHYVIWASKKLVTGPNGIMVAQTFCDILFMKKKTSDINI